MRSVLWAVVLVLGCCTLQPALLGHLPSPQAAPLTPDLPTKVENYEVVVPVRIDRDGPRRNDEQHFLRKRRWVEEDNPDDTDADLNKAADQLTYLLNAFQEEMYLDLVPDVRFLSDGLIVENLGMKKDDPTTLVQDDSFLGKHCFYTGQIRGQPDSLVVLSVCHSLFGAVYSGDKHFLIEPHNNSSRNTDATEDDSVTMKPHRLYRLPGNNTQQTCGVKGKGPFESFGVKLDEARNLMKTSTPHPSNNTHHRKRRSVSQERNVEMLVVADSRMVEFHGSNLHHYILTLMSIVASIYRHHSIGNAINIVVIKVQVLRHQYEEPMIKSNAVATLSSFCEWQHRRNPATDDHPEHYDNAILLTRQDLCRASNRCDTLGLAEIGTICDIRKSCSIVEDNGLSAAFTIAHEVGHVFNLRHDDTQQCKDINLKPEVKKVMASTLDTSAEPWSWSNCSRVMITEFMDGGYGECLLDKPAKLNLDKYMSDQIKQTFPGEKYNLDEQCKLVFGNESERCPADFFSEDVTPCATLWCRNLLGGDSGCRTQHMPWADGTYCGYNYWCEKGKCVRRQKYQSLEGGWSSWTTWGSCSRSCGGGVKQSIRLCNSPKPENGGRYCIGKKIKYKSCNIHNCPLGSNTFREEQCEAYNGKHFNINSLDSSVRWVPKYSGIQTKDRCKLYCQVYARSAFYLLEMKVKDGTKCGPDTSDICVNGQCWRAGCDNRLGSSMKRDKCGVCGGDSTTCDTVSKFFNEQVRYGYNDVYVIPTGASRIDIRQGWPNNTRKDDNYLALKNSRGEFILNGDQTVTALPSVVLMQSALIDYSGANVSVERINSSYILKEPLHLLVLSVEKVLPPYIRLQYVISRGSRNSRKPGYYWHKRGPFTECSSVCNGYRVRRAVCKEKRHKRIVSDQKCESAPHLFHKKPRPVTKRCNKYCKLSWQIVEKTKCSASCGTGVINRKVMCVKTDLTNRAQSYVADKHCEKISRKSPAQIPCQGPCQYSHWQYTYWSTCSNSCGGGIQTRDGICMNKHGRRLPNRECRHEKKIIMRSCNEASCAKWIAQQWTACSVTCGKGKKHREVWCRRGKDIVSDSDCSQNQRPQSTMECSMPRHCAAWDAGSWGQCSAKCGKGHKERAVKCRFPNGIILADSECDATVQPTERLTCIVRPCPKTTLINSIIATPTLSPDRRYNSPSTESWTIRPTQWRTGGWTTCSATCGYGSRMRYVSCRNKVGDIADDSMCSYDPKPPSTEQCLDSFCGEWRTGEWTQCSVSCGEGRETRYVACVTLEEFDTQIEDPSRCDVLLKPQNEQLCNRQPCTTLKDLDITSIDTNRVVRTSHWRAGPWGGCSSTCEEGWQRRLVECHDETGLSTDCNPDSRPADYQHCTMGACPMWNNGAWIGCAVSCGGSTQHRKVACQLPSGQTLHDSSCDIMERPPSSQVCGTAHCPKDTKWHKGPWSTSEYSNNDLHAQGAVTDSVPTKSDTGCSVSCGKGGHRMRKVKCLDKNGKEVDTLNCAKKKPKSVRRCRGERCPQWKTTQWSQCSVTCGNGTQERRVKCSENDTHVNLARCSDHEKPDAIRECKMGTCDKYMWSTDDWAQCSVSCGYGLKARKVTCRDKENKKDVHPRYCNRGERPKKKRKCYEAPCPYIWVAGKWSPCSESCSEGMQVRTVKCQHATSEGWIVSGNVSEDHCSKTEKPSMHQECNFGDCNAFFHWKVAKWGRCSVVCGQGNAKRKVYCMDVDNHRQPFKSCEASLKPPDKMRCHRGPCYFSSCSELQKMASIRKDGEYNLLVANKLLKIYCYGMQKSNPKEYITLSAGELENYSEIYNKRLLRPQSCPYNGTRPPSNCHLCSSETYGRSAMTTFSKVRLNVTSLHIITDSFKFSSTEGARGVAFGSAGDCYSAENCPQGRFHLNLQGTGLKVHTAAQWQGHGFQPSTKITVRQDGLGVEGRCGGYCGDCYPMLPSGQPGLQLQIIL